MFVVAKMMLPLQTINTKAKSENKVVNPVHLFISPERVSKLITGSFFHEGSFE
jgi:hypothetical protein